MSTDFAKNFHNQSEDSPESKIESIKVDYLAAAGGDWGMNLPFVLTVPDSDLRKISLPYYIPTLLPLDTYLEILENLHNPELRAQLFEEAEIRIQTIEILQRVNELMAHQVEVWSDTSEVLGQQFPQIADFLNNRTNRITLDYAALPKIFISMGMDELGASTLVNSIDSFVKLLAKVTIGLHKEIFSPELFKRAMAQQLLTAEYDKMLALDDNGYTRLSDILRTCFEHNTLTRQYLIDEAGAVDVGATEELFGEAQCKITMSTPVEFILYVLSQLTSQLALAEITGFFDKQIIPAINYLKSDTRARTTIKSKMDVRHVYKSELPYFKPKDFDKLPMTSVKEAKLIDQAIEVYVYSQMKVLADKGNTILNPERLESILPVIFLTGPSWLEYLLTSGDVDSSGSLVTLMQKWKQEVESLLNLLEEYFPEAIELLRLKTDLYNLSRRPTPELYEETIRYYEDAEIDVTPEQLLKYRHRFPFAVAHLAEAKGMEIKTNIPKKVIPFTPTPRQPGKREVPNPNRKWKDKKTTEIEIVNEDPSVLWEKLSNRVVFINQDNRPVMMQLKNQDEFNAFIQNHLLEANFNISSSDFEMLRNEIYNYAVDPHYFSTRGKRIRSGENAKYVDSTRIRTGENQMLRFIVSVYRGYCFFRVDRRSDEIETSDMGFTSSELNDYLDRLGLCES